MNDLLRMSIARVWCGLIKKSDRWAYFYVQHRPVKKTIQWLIPLLEYSLLLIDPSNTYGCLAYQQWRFELLFNLIEIHFLKFSIDEKKTDLLREGDLHV